MPKPTRINPEMKTINTEAMGAEKNYLAAKAAATTQYAGTEQNVNQATLGASVHANTLAQQIANANVMNNMKMGVEQANVDTRNQASLYNLQTENQFNQDSAKQTLDFRQNQANAMATNLGDKDKGILGGFNNYANSNLGINALEKGYNAGLSNQALLQKALNDPKSLTPEDVIRLNSITGGNFDPSKLTPPITPPITPGQ